MRKTVVLNAVGVTPALLGEHTPRLRAFAAQGRVAPVAPMLPAVTCAVQSTYLTGLAPAAHGIVGNGWYDRDDAEVKFWKQSNHLVQAPKLWDLAGEQDPGFTCANVCWWYAMYSGADYTVTPRPMYPADGRKLPDCWTHPADLRGALQADLGTFPLFQYWGPGASIASTRWVAEAAKWIERRHSPTLSLVYLPHLDYPLQKLGPDPDAVANDLRALDAVCGDLIEFFEERGAAVVVLSEYGIVPVSRPVHLNRVLLDAGMLTLRDERGRELLDAGASRAFAVADHQVAHVYVRDAARVGEVRALLEAADGVAEVLGDEGKRRAGLEHPRAGDLVAVAEPDAWFTYYFWLDDDRAPDYARTVDIHHKPGYDPVELFLDPAIRAPKLTIAAKLARKAAGFRTLMDVIPLDATLVRGSHGVPAADPATGPLIITRDGALLGDEPLRATDVRDIILAHLAAGGRIPAAA